MGKKTSQPDQLSKIAADDYVAHSFAEKLERQGLLRAPKNLKESILLQSQTPAAYAGQVIDRTSQRLEFLFYSLKCSVPWPFC